MKLSLTRSQYLLWAGQELSPDSPLYNMPFRFDIYGKVDQELFALAFQQMISESSITSARLLMTSENLPELYISDDIDPQHDNLDATQWSSEKWYDWLTKQNQKPFDLAVCAYRSYLVRRGDNHYVWYFNQHHLVTDAWGISVQYKRLSDLYSQLAQGKKPENNATLPAFADYVEHEKHAAQNPKKQDYWKNIISDTPPAPSLYNYKGSRPYTRTSRHGYAIDADTLTQLDQLCQERDIISFTADISRLSVFMTCLFALIYRLSGQEHLAIGTPAHNRSKPAFKNTPGPFIEFFPVQVEIDRHETFGSLYQKVKTGVMGYLMNSGSGLASPALSSSFYSVLNYIHADFPDFAGIATDAEWLSVDHCDPRHDLRMHVIDYKRDGQFQVQFDLNHEVFNSEQRQEVIHIFQTLLAAMIADRSQEIEAVPLVSPNPWQESVSVTSTTQLTDLLFRYITADNDLTALICGEERVSYSELYQKISSLQVKLQQSGVSSGDAVAIHLQRSVDLVVSILACIATGAHYVPIPIREPATRASHMLRDSDARFVIAEMASEIIKLDPSVQLISPSGSDSQSKLDILSSELAYIMYTSGSTGKPKGVMISRDSLAYYLDEARKLYSPQGNQMHMPLFSSVGFDLTVTSLFLPMTTGGSLHIYPEPLQGPDMSIIEVAENHALTAIKATPSHIQMLDPHWHLPQLQVLILGGEALSSDVIRDHAMKHPSLRIYNEYGPTEATVGCIVHTYDPTLDVYGDVPIGKPLSGTRSLIVNRAWKEQPVSVTGELLISGPGLAVGYLGDEDKTQEKFIMLHGTRYYCTGDRAFQSQSGVIHFQGRADDQIKIGGRRIETGEIASAIARMDGVRSAVVTTLSQQRPSEAETNCRRCGLPSHYPGVSFTEDEICSLCLGYDAYEQRVKGYFREMDDLKRIFDTTERSADSEYDCIMLLSGGKDSSYALGRLADLGIKVLAFTLDNGYISQEALANVQRVCRALGVDHVFGKTEAMNEIFVDSLQRYQNVCNGCFKTIYTLSTKIALEKKIPYIVTGLSRGQFFETRLTEELFTDETINFQEIDDVILHARKLYHRTPDAVNRLLDAEFFEDDEVFEKVQFLDFYRYCDVELTELMAYLKHKLPWSRPSDTGRSTNCLINQVGIQVHREVHGYSNYAFPYSWDVRVGHKERDEALAEVNEVVDDAAVARIKAEIGYSDHTQQDQTEQLAVFYTSDRQIPTADLRQSCREALPDYMVPWHYIHVPEIPLTSNGKTDVQKLVNAFRPTRDVRRSIVKPKGAIETMLHDIWTEVMVRDDLSTDDQYLSIGGNSLMAIRILSRINKKFRLQLKLHTVFKYNTIQSYAQHIEATIRSLMTTS